MKKLLLITIIGILLVGTLYAVDTNEIIKDKIVSFTLNTGENNLKVIKAYKIAFKIDEETLEDRNIINLITELEKYKSESLNKMEIIE